MKFSRVWVLKDFVAGFSHISYISYSYSITVKHAAKSCCARWSLKSKPVQKSTSHSTAETRDSANIRSDLELEWYSYCLAKITSVHTGLRNNMTNLKWLALTIAIESFVCLRIYSSLTEVQLLSSLIQALTGIWSVFKTQIVLYLAIYQNFPYIFP